MKLKVLFIAVAVLILAITPAFAICPPQSIKCGVDDLDMYFTGKTFTENGHLFYVYRCPQNHEMGVRCY